MTRESSVKIRVDLPNHWAVGGESMWAEYLGNNLYKIKNIPFYAYGLNFDDIVYAVADSDELKPEIKRVVEQSGHKTIRIIFTDDKNKENHINTIESIRDDNIGYEGWDENQFTLNVTPQGGYDRLLDELDELEKNEILSYETCEQRIEGSFDDVPEE